MLLAVLLACTYTLVFFCKTRLACAASTRHRASRGPTTCHHHPPTAAYPRATLHAPAAYRRHRNEPCIFDLESSGGENNTKDGTESAPDAESDAD